MPPCALRLKRVTSGQCSNPGVCALNLVQRAHVSTSLSVGWPPIVALCLCEQCVKVIVGRESRIDELTQHTRIRDVRLEGHVLAHCGIPQGLQQARLRVTVVQFKHSLMCIIKGNDARYCINHAITSCQDKT